MRDRMVWVDLEMTGLDPEKDVILEIALLVTDGELNPLDEGVDLVVAAPPGALDGMLPIVQDMHARSGLTEAVRVATTTLEQAGAAALEAVKRHIPVQHTAPLCGSSIATDRTFIAKYLPELDNWLHYRMVDVSTVKELCRRWYPHVLNTLPAKTGGHRALADIRESIAELKFYRSNIFVPPTAVVLPSTAETPEAAAEVPQ